MTEKIVHKDYEEAIVDGKNGIYYGNYFFPLTDGKDTKVRALFGSEVKLGQCVGFCTLKKSYLTQTVMKNKQCLNKQCVKFLRTPYSEAFWKERDEKLAAKKVKKQAQQEYLSHFSDK